METESTPDDEGALRRRVAELEREVDMLRRAGSWDSPLADLTHTEAIVKTLELVRATAQETEIRLRTMLREANDYAVVGLDMDGRITLWNVGARGLLGWEEAEVLGRNVSLVFTPEDREAGIPEIERAEARANGRTEHERWRIRKDGSRFFAAEVVMALRNGEAGGYLKILRDRAEVRRLEQEWRGGEERLRLILESAIDYAIFTVDRAGLVTSWNTGAQRLLGYTEAEALGIDSRVIFTPEDRAARAPEREIDKALHEGRAANERWHVRKDGSRFWGSGLMMPLQAGHSPPGLLKIMRDGTERRRADEMRQLLIDELNHRVKNTLATVQALADQTLKGADSPEAFAAAFRGRLLALARAHDLLTREAWEGVELEDIARAALETWFQTGRVGLFGPRVRVTSGQALALSLALHELTTNATKYGALSVSEGRVDMRWTGAPDCEVYWVETGGPSVTPPVRQGFGSRILRRALATELGRPVDLMFPATGVMCTLRFEVRPPAAAPA